MTSIDTSDVTYITHNAMNLLLGICKCAESEYGRPKEKRENESESKDKSLTAILTSVELAPCHP